MSTLLDAREAPQSAETTNPDPPATSGVRYTLGVYALSRILYLAVAVGSLLLDHWSLGRELRNWDGRWYVALAATGYPHALPGHAVNDWSTLGFFPLFSILMWALGQVLARNLILAGVLLSLGFGAVATVLIHRLARAWWGEAAARRAILLFCLFPGTVVFSMVYTEGLLLTLVAGSLLALQRRRWLTAGVLAGISTAVGPVAVMIIPACVVVAVRELRRRGWRDPEARRSLLAPLLSPVGIAAFGAYLWAHVGTPFATLIAQRDNWDEHTRAIALLGTGHHVFEELKHVHSLAHPHIDLNDVSGLLGAALLAYGLYLLWRHRPSVPLAAVVWTLGVALLAVTSAQTPPNPRMLICAFPVVLVLGAHFTGRRYRWILGTSVFMLVVMSAITFSGTGLRP